MHHVTPFAFAALAAVATAQSVVVPNASANVSSTLVLNNPLRETGNPRTYMMGINASQLSGIPVGSLIVGVSMRAGHTSSNPAVWPTADVLYTDYEVTIGSCLPPASWTNAFQSNFTGTPVMARDGAMVVPAGTYANVNAAPLYARLGYVAMWEGAMATPVGIDLPVVVMERPEAG